MRVWTSLRIFSPPPYILTLEGEGQGIAKKNNNNKNRLICKAVKKNKDLLAPGAIISNVESGENK